jgi:hypothetical protein
LNAHRLTAVRFFAFVAYVYKFVIFFCIHN